MEGVSPYKSVLFMTVVIVDDDPDSLELITRYVKYGGYDSLEVESGEDAIGVIAEVLPEAVILDAVMPEITGLDVIREIKKNRKTRNIPIIMVSALGPGIKLMLDPDVQADYYMSKPFSGKELLLILDRLVNKSDDEEVWVNYNGIRKVARAHRQGCIHCTPSNSNSEQVEWKKYPSLFAAKLDSERRTGFKWTECKVCMNMNH